MSNSISRGRKARLICYYLPQFYPIPENDKWWGRGFTEWTNVAKAKPLFRGHYQPRLPADLGFYDLRVPETRAAQAELAEQHGIEGFCYWHYWFAGKRLLERPFSEVLKSGEPKLPFCLGWANDSWTGIWHGCVDRMLIEQTYPGKKDEEDHFYSVLSAFGESRYIRVEEKPVFYVYMPHNLPDPQGFTDRWRELALKAGLKGLYFVGEDHTLGWRPRENGFDAKVPHKPGISSWRLDSRGALRGLRLLRVGCRKIFRLPCRHSYKAFVDDARSDLSDDADCHPSVLSNWDNTPRSGRRGYVLLDSSPELFRIHLRETVRRVGVKPPEKRLIFLKSWNEWAEGNYLEPDQRYGRAFLEVTKDEVLTEEDL